MNWLGALWALYKFELTSASRERNVLLYVIMIPALLYPLMVWFTMSTLSFLIGLSEQQVCRVQIVGLPAAMSSLPKSLHQEHKTWDIQTLETDNQSIKVDLKLTFAEPQGPIRVFATYDSRSARSVNCKEQFESFFVRYRDYWAEQEIRNSGVPLWEFQPFTVQYFNESKAADVGKFLLGILLPFTLIVILSLGGMYSAIDCTAGERERGCWETSMTLAVPRSLILLSKYGYVTTMSFVAGALNLASMTFSLRSFIAPLSSDWANETTMSLPLRTIPIILLGTFLLSALISAIMLLLTGLARTFREGQSLVSPMFLFMLLPTTLVLDPNLDLDIRTALCPVINIALLWRESLQNNVPLSMAGLTVAATTFCVTICLAAAYWLANQERLMLEGGVPEVRWLWRGFFKGGRRERAHH